METPNFPISILHELLRGIIYYIPDVKTYYNFALTSKYCASLTREYRAYKANEFSTPFIVEKEEHLDRMAGIFPMVCKVLPNGRVHGFVYWPNVKNPNVIHYYKNGILTNYISHVTKYNYFDSDKKQLSNIDHLHVTYVTTNYFCDVTANRFVNIELKQSSITSHKCKTCGYYHYFNLWVDGMFSLIIILRTCSERKWTIVGKMSTPDEWKDWEDEQIFYKRFLIKKLYQKYKKRNK